MKKRRRIGLGLVSMIAIGTLFTPAVHWRMIGWSRGEAFYQGRPTSWWRDEIKQYDVVHFSTGDIYWMREPSWWKTWWLTHISSDSIEFASRADPALLGGLPETIPVLIELLEDEDDDVRYLAIHAFARIGSSAKSAFNVLLNAMSKPNNTKYERTIRWALRCIDDEWIDHDID